MPGRAGSATRHRLPDNRWVAAPPRSDGPVTAPTGHERSGPNQVAREAFDGALPAVQSRSRSAPFNGPFRHFRYNGSQSPDADAVGSPVGQDTAAVLPKVVLMVGLGGHATAASGDQLAEPPGEFPDFASGTYSSVMSTGIGPDQRSGRHIPSRSVYGAILAFLFSVCPVRLCHNRSCNIEVAAR